MRLSLTALCGGKAESRYQRNVRSIRADLRLRVLLSAVCLLFTAVCLFVVPFATVSSQGPESLTSPSPTPSPSPSPSPSPTPLTGLHQWGAVTLFHGLPSDRVHAIAQGPDGSMWFGTEAGLAKFDGRRTQTMTISGLQGGRVTERGIRFAPMVEA